jgi:thiosulfate/3-mercaptopyruvate sulfurtransferase
VNMIALTTALLSTLWSGSTMAASAVAPLIDAERLQTIACEPNVVVLDIRSTKIDGQARDAYAQGHVPCAVHTDYIEGGWRTKVDGVPGMLPPLPKLEALVGGLGIDDSTWVVVAPLGADAKSMAAGARVYWTLKLLGHERVSILDGGTLGYAKGGARPLEKGARSPTPKSFVADLQTDMLVSADDVLQGIEAQATLVDYRRQDEFSGLNRNGKTPRAGTLPGAANVPLEWLTRDNGGEIRSPAALAKLYTLAGVAADAKQVAFCNTRHNSSLGWFVARELLGNRDVLLYDGSMAQWSRNEARPMARAVDLTD